MGLGFLESLLEGGVVGIDLLAKLRGEVVAEGVGNHEITIGQTLHEGAGSEAVCTVIREIRLPEHMQAGDVAHVVIVHPEAAHRVVNGRVDAHGTLVGIFSGDVLIHLEEVAVAFLDGFLTKTLDGIGEIQIDAEPAGADSPALVAGFLGRAG